MKQSAVARFVLLYANSHRETKETHKIWVILDVVLSNEFLLIVQLLNYNCNTK